MMTPASQSPTHPVAPYGTVRRGGRTWRLNPYCPFHGSKPTPTWSTATRCTCICVEAGA